MAADAYLKVAAGQLRQAIDTLKREAAAVRSAATSTQQQAQHEITTLKAAKLSKEVGSQAPDLSPDISRSLLNEARKLGDQISALEQQINNQNQQSEQLARNKEFAASDLESQAVNLENMATDSRLL